MDVNVPSQIVVDILNDEEAIQNGIEVEESGKGVLPSQEAEEKTEDSPNEMLGNFDAKVDETEEKEDPLEAKCIYVLMKKDFRLSRNARAKWYFKHLGALQGVLKDGQLLERDLSKESDFSPKKFTIKKYEDVSDLQSSSEELDAVGVVPFLENIENLESYKASASDWDYDVSHLYDYYVTPRTTVRFLAQRYRFAYLLDMSPSVSGPDFRRKKLKNGDTLASALMPALRASLTGLARPFYVPGSQLLLKPDLYVSVIAWSPFIADGAQAVLHQGWLLTPANLEAFLDGVFQKLKIMESRISLMASEAYNKMQFDRSEEERIIGGLFEDTMGNDNSMPYGNCSQYTKDIRNSNGCGLGTSSVITTASADVGFVNMVRTGMLALQLMPGNSSASIVVVTDGELCAPDLEACDNLLNQLRTKVISLSFLQVSHSYMPHTGLARMPFHDMMEYMAYSTYGAYLPKAPKVNPPDYLYGMNVYHDAFLCWSFRKALQGRNLPDAMPFYYEHLNDYDKEEDEDPSTSHHHGDTRKTLQMSGLHEDGNESDVSFVNPGALGINSCASGFPRKGGKYHNVNNGFFKHTNRDRFTLKKFESIVKCSLTTLLSCRLREGFTVNEVLVRPPSPITTSSKNGKPSVIQVKLSLPWKISTFIHYIITSESPTRSTLVASTLNIDDENERHHTMESQTQDFDIKVEDNSEANASDVPNKSPPSCQVQVYMEGDYDTMQEITRQTTLENAWLMEQGAEGGLMNRNSKKMPALGMNSKARQKSSLNLTQRDSESYVNSQYSNLWTTKGNITNNAQQLTVGAEIGGGLFPAQNKNRLVRKFFRALQQLRYVDKLISHLEHFGSTSQHYSLPDMIANGAPLFHIPQNSVSREPELYSKARHSSGDKNSRYFGSSNSTFQFASFWRPISSLNINIWHRWLHAHKLHIILHHDHPLPKHLLKPNASGRFTVVQCRKAGVQLAHALRNWSTFILVENTTFIRYLWPEDQGFDNFNDDDIESGEKTEASENSQDKHEDAPQSQRLSGGGIWRKDCPPSSFIIVRLTSKPPCSVVWLAFPGGTCGRLRYKAVQALTKHLKKLTIKQHISWRGESQSQGGTLTPSHSVSSPDMTIGKSTLQNSALGCAGDGGWMENPACIVLEKPIERLLIRYYRIPKDFYNLLEPALQSGTENNFQYSHRISESEGGVLPLNRTLSPQELSFGTYLTLSRYFHCYRWIWPLQAMDDSICNIRVPINTVNRILTTLIRARLKQGFHFAHSNQGIQTMVIELPTKLNSGKDESAKTSVHQNSKSENYKNASDVHSCVMQYVIFPPQIINKNKKGTASSQTDNSSSEEDEMMYEGSDERLYGSEKHIQMVTELWVEPQDGTILDCPTTVWKEMRGKSFNDAKEIIRAHDRDIISSICTHQHIQMSCKSIIEQEQRKLEKQKESTNVTTDLDWKLTKMRTPSIAGPQVTNEDMMCNQFLVNDDRIPGEMIQSSGETDGNNKKIPFVMPSSSVSPMDYHFNITSLLKKSNRIEILLSMFIQDLEPFSFHSQNHVSSDFPPNVSQSSNPFFSGVNVNQYIENCAPFDESLRAEDQDDDAANELLYSEIVQNLRLLHDQEINLSQQDNLELLKHFSCDKGNKKEGIRISPLATMIDKRGSDAAPIHSGNDVALPDTPSMIPEGTSFEYENRFGGTKCTMLSSTQNKRESVVSRISSRLTSGASIGSFTSVGEIASLGSHGLHATNLSGNYLHNGTENKIHTGSSYQSASYYARTRIYSNFSAINTNLTGCDSQAIHVPNWLCYVKSTKNGPTSSSANRLMFTIMPKSYKDLKKLLLDEISLSGKDPKSVKIVKTPIQRKKKFSMSLKSNPLFLSRKDSLLAQSPSSSSSNLATPNSANDQSGQASNSSLFRPKTGSVGEKMDKASAIARQKARRAFEKLGSRGLKKSGDDKDDSKLTGSAGKGSGMRPRATTTSGMTNVKPPGRLTSGRGIHGADRTVTPNQNLSGASNTSSSEKPSGILGRSNEKVRQRTQTHSLAMNDHRAPLSPVVSSGIIQPALNSKLGPLTSSSPRPLDMTCKITAEEFPLFSKKSVWGAVSLPIYVFDCTSNVVVNDLIKGTVTTDSQVCVTLNSLFDNNVLEAEENGPDYLEKDRSRCFSRDENRKPNELSDDDKNALPFDGDIQVHCNNIQLAYYKCFSKTLFRSLQLEFGVHRFDIQHTIDNCENENIMEIDITNFLLKVCGHTNAPKHASVEDKDRRAIDTSSNVSPESSTKKQQQCFQLFDNHHSQIKSKFDGLILNSFKSIKLSKDEDLYYYSPNNRCIDDDLPEPPPGDMSRKRRSTKDTIGGSSAGTGATGDEDQSLDDVVDFSKMQINSRLHHLMNDSSSDVGGSGIGEKKISHLDNDNDITSVDIRSSAGQTDMDIGDVESTFRGHLGDTSGENLVENHNLTSLLAPLFLQLSLTIKKKNGSVIGDPKNIKTLPTCIYDLCSIAPTPKPSTLESLSTEEEDETRCIAEKLKLKEITVTLDLVCISLPQNISEFPQRNTLEIMKEKSSQDLKLTSNPSPTTQRPLLESGKFEHEYTVTIADWKDSFSDHQKTLTSFHSMLDSEAGTATGDVVNNEKLPELQNEIVNSLISNIEWMLEDEIAFATIRDVDDYSDIKEEVLVNVAKHVHASQRQSGCVFQAIPLHFVFGPERSYDMFLSAVSDGGISPPGFKLSKIGDNGYYLVHLIREENIPERDDNDVQKNNSIVLPIESSEIDVKTESQIKDDSLMANQNSTRFNLSPVKEVHGHITPPKVDDEEEDNTNTENMSSQRVPHDSSTDHNPFDSSNRVDSKTKDILCQVTARRESLSIIGMNKKDVECSSKNTNSYPDGKKNNCENSWLILQLAEDNVNIYFQYREGQLDAVLPWRQAQQCVTSQIKSLYKRINQKLLLQDLFESRVCNRLLESDEEVWHIEAGTRGFNTIDSGDTNKDDPDEGYQATILEASLNVRFRPGTFRCPKVWEAEFSIHPRLLQTPQGIQLSTLSASGAGGSRAFHAFKSSLNQFTVDNRGNLFVYQDTSPERNIYYMKVLEIINKSQSLGSTSGVNAVKSRASSKLKIDINKSPRKLQSEKESDPPSSKPSRRDEMKKRSVEIENPKIDELPRLLESQDTNSNDTDKIVMQIYGLQSPGSDITNDFYVMLKNKLNDKVIEVLSVMLQRSSKLSPQDVHFIQPPNTKCSFSLHIKLHPLVRKYHSSFIYYLRQNLLSGSTIVEPKYTSPTVSFKDYDDDGNIIMDEPDLVSPTSLPSAEVLLHNGGRGHKELACIAITHLAKGISSNTNDHKEEEEEEENFEKWKDMMKIHALDSALDDTMEDNGNSPTVNVMVRFRVWAQGRSGNDFQFSDLRQELTKNVKNSLWDLVTEECLLPSPISETLNITEEAEKDSNASTPSQIYETTPQNILLSDNYSKSAIEWFEEGLKHRAATIVEHKTTFKIGGSRENIHGNGGISWLKELQHQIELSVPDLKANSFVSSHTEEGQTDFKACSRLFARHEKENQENKFPLSDTYLMVGQNHKHWESCTRFDLGKMKVKDILPKQLSSHQNFQPYVALAKPKMQEYSEECKGEVEEPAETVITTSKRKIRGSIMSLFSPTSSHCSSPSVTPSTPTTTSFPPITTQDRSNSLLKDAISIASSAGAEDNLEIGDFVARQHLVLVKIQGVSVSIYMYNLSRECIERLINSTNNLCYWIDARSALAVSIVAQKAGLFHHQPFFKTGRNKTKDKVSKVLTSHLKNDTSSDNLRVRKPSNSTVPQLPLLNIQSGTSSAVTTNPYIEDNGYLEMLVQNVAPPKQLITANNIKSPMISSFGSKNTINSNRSNDNVYPEVYRDIRPENKILSFSQTNEKPYDHMFGQGSQLMKLRTTDKKHILRKLWIVWSTYDQRQLPIVPDTQVWNQEALEHFEEIGSLSHLEYTPFLFLPDWRQSSNLIKPMESIDNVENEFDETNLRKLNSKLVAKSLSRSSSLSSGNQKTVENPNSHTSITKAFFQEFISYLQTVSGFYPVNMSDAEKKRNQDPQIKRSPSPSVSGISSRGRQLSGGSRRPSSRQLTSPSSNDLNMTTSGAMYLYKSYAEGILLIKLSLCLPYCVLGIYTLDSNLIRQYGLKNQSSKHLRYGDCSTSMQDLKIAKVGAEGKSVGRSIHQQKLNCYCNEIKDFIFMDSFNYDLHLKLAHTYVTGALSGMKVFNKNQSQLPLPKKGFQIVQYLNEFSDENGYYRNHPINADTYFTCETFIVPISMQRNEKADICEDLKLKTKENSNHEFKRLFDYLRENEVSFKFKSMKIEDSSINSNLKTDAGASAKNFNKGLAHILSEFVLTRQALYQLESKEVGLLNEKEMIESLDLSVTLIIANDNDEVMRNDNKEGIEEMRLKYFVIITPKGLSKTHVQKSEAQVKSRIVSLKHLSSRGSVSFSNCGIASLTANDETKHSSPLSFETNNTRTPGEKTNDRILGTFSTKKINDRETMEITTKTLSDEIQCMLRRVVKFATLRCRRDELWELLFMPLRKASEASDKDKKDGSKSNTISIHELKELLSHVHIKKLEDATKDLKELAESSHVKPFPDQVEVSLNKAKEWQNDLIKVLQEKYCLNCRLVSSENGPFKHLIILNQENVASAVASNRIGSPVNPTSNTSYFTLMVFDTSSGKITCSIVSKEPGMISPEGAANLTSDAINTLNDEVAKLSSKMVVSAGVFNVWKGLFK